MSLFPDVVASLVDDVGLLLFTAFDLSSIFCFFLSGFPFDVVGIALEGAALRGIRPVDEAITLYTITKAKQVETMREELGVDDDGRTVTGYTLARSKQFDAMCEERGVDEEGNKITGLSISIDKRVQSMKEELGVDKDGKSITRRTIGAAKRLETRTKIVAHDSLGNPLTGLQETSRAVTQRGITKKILRLKEEAGKLIEDLKQQYEGE